MKPEINNEMDLLLRRLSRSASDSPADGNHLDADELSSYTENALPAAARARYTEHLAECANCRKLIAQLSSPVGVVVAAETARILEPSPLKKFLASLFSPMVLRYAVPALGLIVVAVIGFTVLRRNERQSSVAQLTEIEQSKAPAAHTEQAASPPAGFVDQATEKSGALAPASETHANKSKETQQAAPPPNAPPSVSVAADVEQPSPTPKVEEQAANEPPAPKPVASNEIKRAAEPEAAKQEVQVRALGGLARDKVAESGKREDRSSEDVAAARSAPASARRKAPAEGSIAKLESAEQEKDKNDADTRSVAGRRFRKERGIWIDTAYDSSRNTVNLTRGSEQYRALVADEPAIKTIAEQLDGEIIVVWRGRAYRIQ